MKSGGTPGRAMVLGLLLALATAAAAQQAPSLGRSVQGVVLDGRNHPLASAIVYLKNTQTRAIHSAITDGQGTYAFHQLQPNVTYEVYAEWKGHRSKTRVASQYLSRPDLTLDLTIPVG